MEKAFAEIPGKAGDHRFSSFFIVDGGIKDAIAQLPLRVHVKIQAHEDKPLPFDDGGQDS